jgi:hypothetical protein
MDLFGKKKLEDQISELQASLASLEAEKVELLLTLAKRDEKIRRLSSANQEVNLALKAAEKQAAAISTASASPSGPEKSVERSEEQKLRPRKLKPREMDQLFERLKACRSPRDDLLTACCHSSRFSDEPAIPSQIKKAIISIKSRHGAMILHSPQLFSMILVPPFPFKESLTREAAAFYLEPLTDMMDTPVLIVSAHAGDTFLAVAFSREGFESEETVKSGVMGKHSKGGWSQKRFERLREEDIKSHADLVNEKLAELMGKYGALLKYAVISGDDGLLRQISPGICLPVVERRLERHDEHNIKALLDEVYGFVSYRIEL